MLGFNKSIVLFCCDQEYLMFFGVKFRGDGLFIIDCMYFKLFILELVFFFY